MEKKNIMMIVIIALLLLLLGTIVGVTFFAYNFLKNSQNNSADIMQNVQTVAKLTPDQVESISLGESIVANLLRSSDGKAYVARVSVIIELDNSETKDKNEAAEKTAFIEMMQSKSYIAREVTLSVLRSKTIQDMTRPDAQDIVAGEILQRLQDEFNSNLIVNVRIPELVTS